MKNSNKALVFFAAVFLLGFLDWLTTVVGLLFCGGTELNPVLSGLTRSSLFIFSAVKLAAVGLAGFAAYKAFDITHSKSHLRLTGRFVTVGVSLTVLAMCVVVANNMMVVFNL